MFFRQATIADIPLLIDLRIKQLKDEGEIADRDLKKEMQDFFQEGILDASFIAWLAVLKDDDSKKDEEVIATSGITLYRVTPSYGNPSGRIAHLGNVYTVPSYRRKGIATKLLKMTVDYAQSSGYNFFRVKASKDGKHLYKSFGFSQSQNLMDLIV